MSVVSLLGVKILNNPAKFTDSYEFEITFECLEPLAKDLEWKLIYVGSATSSDHDQELDSLLVGPIPVGVNKFPFEADPPNPKTIPPSEVLGVTVLLLTCSYDGREFVRVGYYVNNEYDSEELNAEPPAQPQIDRVKRTILADKPRVTRFAIKWDSEESAPAEFPPDQPEADLDVDDGTKYGEEEVELEEALKKEEAELAAQEEDDNMEGGEDTAGVQDDDAESEAGSEDLEAPSSDEDEDEEEEEEGGDDEDMEMGEGEDGKSGHAGNQDNQQQGEVMVH